MTKRVDTYFVDDLTDERDESVKEHVIRSIAAASSSTWATTPTPN
ncbi:hypothetical protein ACH427_31940 [Streptomyces sp. NPDC020379]